MNPAPNAFCVIILPCKIFIAILVNVFVARPIQYNAIQYNEGI